MANPQATKTHLQYQCPRAILEALCCEQGGLTAKISAGVPTYKHAKYSGSANFRDALSVSQAIFTAWQQVKSSRSFRLTLPFVAWIKRSLSWAFLGYLAYLLNS